MTWIAVGCFTLDGVLLGLAGYWGRRGGLIAGGLICLALALVVLFFWRRHQRNVEELRAARREVADEARALRDLVRKPPGQS
jgi:hypothetical protein